MFVELKEYESGLRRLINLKNIDQVHEGFTRDDFTGITFIEGDTIKVEGTYEEIRKKIYEASVVKCRS